MENKKIKVMVVDDSAFMRKAISDMIRSDPELTVAGTATDGKDCIAKLAEINPDVITLDLEMPNMNGLEALRVIMTTHPMPVLMLSSYTEDGAKATIEALQIGAVDFIPKGLSELAFNILNIKDDLLRKIKTVSKKKPALSIKKVTGLNNISQGKPSSSIQLDFNVKNGNIDIIAVGSSTGGPKALTDVIINLPKDIPVPIVIVQHMPPIFVKQFVTRLDQTSDITVRVAENGEKLVPACIFVAPGGIHTTVISRGKDKHISLTDQPSDSLHKPSVDVMMKSVADIYGSKSLGVIMTGMGNDGMMGMTAIKRKNGITIAQDEASCVVYGMPKSAVDAGVVDRIVPLSSIASEMVNIVCKK